MNKPRLKVLAKHTTLVLLYAAVAIALSVPDSLVAAARPAGRRIKTVSRTFSNDSLIDIAEEGAANPYPAIIDVSGFRRGVVRDVNLRLRGFSHVIASDVDVMLVSPDGRNAIVLSDVSSGPANDATVTLDDQAPAALPASGGLTTGTFQPANFPRLKDEFPAPAPAPADDVALATFNGTNPNGQWRLFVVDDLDGFVGSVAGGWELQITAKVKKGGKRKRKR